MGEVSILIAKMALVSARRAGLDFDALTAGLSFNEPSLRRRRTGRVPWDDFCTFVERWEIAMGGPEKSDAFAAREWNTIVPPQLQRMFGTMVSAKTLYRFMVLTVGPALFLNLDLGFEELPGDRIRVTARLQPGSQPCRSFFRNSLVTLPNVACYLGLPPAMIEVEEITDRSHAAVLQLPPSQTLLSRARRASVPALRDAVVWLVDFLAGEARAESDRLSALLARRPSRAEPDLVERVVAFERARGLTSKQSEVLALVVRGLSNKEIARELDCAENTVEFHVTQLLRKAAADSRAQLIARFWAEAHG